MGAGVPTARMIASSDVLSKRSPELIGELNELTTVIAAHASYVENSQGLADMVDELRQELLQDQPDRGRVAQMIDRLASEAQRGRGDKRQLDRIRKAIEAVRASATR